MEMGQQGTVQAREMGELEVLGRKKKDVKEECRVLWAGRAYRKWGMRVAGNANQ